VSDQQIRRDFPAVSEQDKNSHNSCRRLVNSAQQFRQMIDKVIGT
jgi:hypothetical protein